MKPFDYPELKPACPAAPMCNCTGGCENKTEEFPAENTKALEVAHQFVTDVAEKRGYKARDLSDYEQAVSDLAPYIAKAIDEATDDLRAQLAERDAKLAAERSRIYQELVRLAELAQTNKNSAKFHSPGWPEMQSALVRLYRTLEATRQPTQERLTQPEGSVVYVSQPTQDKGGE